MPALFTVPGIVSGRFLGLLINIAIFVIVLYWVRSGKQVKIRRVAGLDAIDEAVGRAAEMGRPFVFSYGLASTFGYLTVAALSLLGHVSRLCVKDGTRLIVPTGGTAGSSIVREVAVDIVKTSYLMEGKPEEFNADDIPYLSDQQFAYSGGYIGILQRTRPAGLVMIGGMAEAMSIAETSNSVGAITITAGSYISNVAALACCSDYILIGEEAPAAGAYLSEDPIQKATVQVQDLFKYASIALIILGIIAVNMGSNILIDMLLT